MAKKIRKYFYPLLLLAIGIYVSKPLLVSGFIPTHDGEYHIVRLWQFDKNIQEGNLLPIWAPDLNSGYGVPLFAFFYPLPNYVGEIFHLLNFSFINSVKYELALSLIFSGLFFYFWMKCFFKEKFAFLGSLLYLLAPYHLLDIYVRGSVGEAWSLTLIPLVLFSVTKLIQKNFKDNKIFFGAVVSLSLLLLSHNILGVMFFFFALLYTFTFYIHDKKKIRARLFLVFILAFAISAFFWLPIFFESRYVSGLEIVNYKDHFPALFQLIFPSWGTGFSIPGVSDEISFQIGIVHLLAVLLAGYIVLKRRKDKILIFFLVCFFTTAFLLLETSGFVWQTFSFMKYFQYPWRLLSLAIVVSSFLAGYISQFKYQNLLFWLMITFTFIFYFPYAKPVIYQPRSDDFYLLNRDWTSGNATLGNSFLPIWLKNKQKPFLEKVEIISGKGGVSDLKMNTGKAQFTADITEKAKIRYNNAYFPGWTVKVDGRNEEVDYSEGLIDFIVPAGSHKILIIFKGSFIRNLAKLISAVSILILVLIAFKKIP